MRDRPRDHKKPFALALNGLTCETFVGGRHSPQSVVWQKALRCWVVCMEKDDIIFSARPDTREKTRVQEKRQKRRKLAENVGNRH